MIDNYISDFIIMSTFNKHFNGFSKTIRLVIDSNAHVVLLLLFVVISVMKKPIMKLSHSI